MVRVGDGQSNSSGGGEEEAQVAAWAWLWEAKARRHLGAPTSIYIETYYMWKHYSIINEKLKRDKVIPSPSATRKQAIFVCECFGYLISM